MKNLYLTLLFLFCLPGLVLGHSAKADRNLEKLTFDSTNQLKTVDSGAGGGAVTNAGTFAVQEDGAALTALQLLDNMISGTGANISQLGGVAVSMNTGLRDAGTQRVTISTDDLVPVSLEATADITMQLEDVDVAEANPLPVRLSDGTNFVDPAVLGTTTYTEGTTKASVIGCVRKDALGSSVNTDNEIAPCQTNSDGLVRSTAGYPITEIAPFDLFNGAGETQIAATNLGASKAYAITGTGRIVKVCISVSLGTPFGEDMSIIFFDADPTITIEDTSLLVADAESAEAVISLTAAGFRDNFATVKLNCQTVDEPYDSITHVVFASEGLTTYDDEDIVLRLWVERKS